MNIGQPTRRITVIPLDRPITAPDLKPLRLPPPIRPAEPVTPPHKIPEKTK